MTIGIIYIATGNYIEFFTEYYDSAEQNFIPEAKKTYFVFTDKDHPYLKKHNVIHIPQHQEYWPYAVLHKFHYILQIQHLYNEIDYLFLTNANLKFLHTVYADEIIPSEKENHIVAVIGPWLYYNKRSLDDYFENNSLSAAFVEKEKRKIYFASGLWGGRRKEFLKIAFQCRNWVEIDLSKNIFAKWEDQAYLNKYLINLNNIKILSPSYLYPEEHTLKQFSPKILVLYKQKKDPLKKYYRKYHWNENKKFKNKFQYYKHLIIYYIIKFLKKLE